MAESPQEQDQPLWAKTIYALAVILTVASVLSLGDAKAPKKNSSKAVVEGYRGAIATASPEASEAALAILMRGGNAADAMVAASFAVSVTRPQSTGLGGGGFLVYHDAQSKQNSSIDFRETAPRAAHETMYQHRQESLLGPRAGGTPGLVKGLVDVFEKHGSGRLTLAQVMAPAIKLARHGFRVDRGLAANCNFHKAKLALYPSSAEIFLPGGKALQEGDLLIQKDLARTLQHIASKGAKGFYEGPVADAMAATMKKDGGLIDYQDLLSYKAVHRKPIVGTYHGKSIVTMPPPAGGHHLIQMLNILEEFELAQYHHGSVEHLHLLAEALKRAYADRAHHSGDPAFWDVPVKWLTSKTYARHLADSIDLELATPSSAIAAGKPNVHESNQTTHISIVDRWGNAASSTQTINTGLGSKYVVPGAGFLMNNEMDDFAARIGVANAYGATASSKANLIKAGKRPLSSMSPSLVFDRRGRLIMAVGTPGGTKIMTSVLQVILNRLDFQKSPKNSVFAPRVHHQWIKPAALQFEYKRAPDHTIQSQLKARKQDFVISKGRFCNVQAIFRDPKTGKLTAVSDNRGTGRPKAW